VGGETEKQDFILHKSFATQSSRFFQTALHGDWREALEKRIPLPEAQTDDFQVYAEWLYTGRIRTLAWDALDASSTIVRLYVLGDYLGDDRFGNAVIDILVRNSSFGKSCIKIEGATVNMAWDKTLPGSPLRNLLVQLIVCDLMDEIDSPCFPGADIWSKEVSAEVLNEIRAYSHSKNQIKSTVQCPVHNKEKCAYHKHDKEYPGCT